MAQLSFLRKMAGLMLLGGLPGLALAQVPVAAYQFTALSGTFVPLPATATAVPVLLADDVVSTVLPLGFQFVYGGIPYINVVASSNGFLSFNTAASSSLSNNLMGGQTSNRPLVAPFWDDLNGNPAVSPTARASYGVTGSAPNRVFTFEWLNWARYGVVGAGTGGAYLSFQVLLHEGSNVVEFSYRPEVGTASPLSASIGLAGTPATDFLSLSDAGPAPAASPNTDNVQIAQRPATGQHYRFTPPTTGTCLPVSSLVAGPYTTTTAQLQFMLPAGSTGAQVSYQPVGGGPATTVSPQPTASPVTLTGLVPGTGYAVTVQAVCAAGASTNPATTTVHTAPANDEPTGAVTLPLNATCQPTTGSIGYSTTTPPNGYTNPGLCGSGTGGANKDVWYRFQTAAAGAPGSTAVRVAKTGPAYTQYLRLFRSTNGTGSGPFTEVSCTFAPGTSTRDFTGLTPATPYFLSVNSAGSTAADTLNRFDICLTPTPACVPPTQLRADTITTTTARLTLLPSFGNTSFVVTYQALPNGPTATATFTAPPYRLTGLLPGTRYSVSVQGFCGSSPAGNPLTTTFNTVALPAPANDTPAGATPLTVNATCLPTTGTTVGATASGSGTGAGCTGSNVPDVWFRFTTAASPALQNVLITVAGRRAGQVRLYDGGTRLACSAAPGPNQTAPPLTGTNLSAAHAYLISVSGYSATDTAGVFSICLTSLAPTPTAANDDCAQATPLPVGTACNPLTGTTSNATPSAGLPASTCIPAGYADVWYRAVVPASGAVTFSTSAAPASTANPLTDTEIEVYDGSCGSLRSLGCNDDANGTFFAQLGLNGLPPGTALLVRVVGYGGRQGSFGLCATDGAAACAPPTGLTVTPTSATAVSVSFGAVPGAYYRLVYTPAAGGTTQQVYGTAPPVALTNLLPNTAYNLTVYTNCGSTGTTPNVVTLPVTTTFTSRPAGALATAAALTDQVALFPNPAHTRFTLTVPAGLAANAGTATLRNALGQTVREQRWAAQTGPLALPVDVSSLTPGVYWLRLQTSAGPLLQRVVVE